MTAIGAKSFLDIFRTIKTQTKHMIFKPVDDLYEICTENQWKDGMEAFSGENDTKSHVIDMCFYRVYIFAEFV